MPSSLPPLPNRLPALPANAPYRLALVLPWPSEDDCRIGRPLTTSAGHLLRGVLAANGLVLDNEVAVCHLSQHYLGTWEAGGWEGAEVQQGIAALARDLSQWRPNIILGLDDPRLGAGVLHLLRNGNVAPHRTPSGYQWTTKLGKWRGSLFMSQSFGGVAEVDALALDQVVRGNEVGVRCPDMQVSNPASTTNLPSVPVRADHEAMSAAKNEESRLRLASEAQEKHQTERPCECYNGTLAADGSSLTTEVKECLIPTASPQGSGPLRGLSFKALCSYSPVYVQSVWSKAFEMRQDVRRAREEARSAELTLPTTNISYGPVE